MATYNGVQTKYPISKLKKVFNKHKNKKHWKNPVNAIVKTKKEALILKESIRFYQADIANIREITVPIKHKEGLVYMQGKAYNVTSKGYQALKGDTNGKNSRMD